VGAAAIVPSLVDVSVVAVSVVASVAAAGSLVVADESAVVAVVSSSASAAVVSHPNTRETNTDASFLFTADPLCVIDGSARVPDGDRLASARPRLVASNALQ
jgi:hypothetical protein